MQDTLTSWVKSLLICCLFITISFSTNAQLSKGQWLVGSDISFSRVLYDDNNTNSIRYSLFPNVGYFVADKLVCGLKFDYSFLYPRQNHISTYGLLAFARYYLLPAESTVNIYADLSFGYSKVEYSYSRFHAYQWAPSVGAAFFLNQRVSLNIALGFLAFDGDLYERHHPSQLALNVGCQFHLGD